MDLSLFESLFRIRDALEAQVIELVAPSTLTEEALRRKGPFPAEPKLDLALLRRLDQERRTALTALRQQKPVTESMLKDVLEAVANPFRAMPESGGKAPPVKVTPTIDVEPSTAKPDVSTKAKKPKRS